MRLFFTGDIHREFDVHKLSALAWPEQKSLTREDFLVICGDFGCIWDGGRTDKYWLDWHNDKPYTTLVCLGNHENYDLIEKMPQEDWHGDKVRRARENVIMLKRGGLYDLNGINLWTMGGAASHDLEYRIPGRSWWPQEIPSFEELDDGLSALSRKASNKPDIIVTHCAPTSIQQQLSSSFQPDVLTNYLELVRTDDSFKHWYFGHYHTDKDIGGKFHCLYNRIIEYKEEAP